MQKNVKPLQSAQNIKSTSGCRRRFKRDLCVTQSTSHWPRLAVPACISPLHEYIACPMEWAESPPMARRSYTGILHEARTSFVWFEGLCHGWRRGSGKGDSGGHYSLVEISAVCNSVRNSSIKWIRRRQHLVGGCWWVISGELKNQQEESSKLRSRDVC